MARARNVAVVLLLAAVLSGLRGGEDAAHERPARAASTDHSVAVVLAREAQQRRERAAARQQVAREAEARRLRRSRTVRGALRRAWLEQAISRSTYEELRGVWWRANRDRQRLSGTRRAELGAVIAMAEGLARERRLSAGRLDAVFLTIRRNREFWMTRALPRPGARVTFGRDPVVFEYYAGRGLAIQPLASFGKANALAGACVRAASPHRCRPAALRRLLERMVALGSERGGFLAWEYLVAFGGGSPPWISAMTQATGAQALARGHRALGEQAFAGAARRALGAFSAAPPVGIAVPSGDGARYAMYSFAPDLQILNGELQALIGLRDVARITGSDRARRLYARGERVARRSVRAFDTGAWSLYSAGGAESTLSYHRLLAGFLDGLCQRTARPTYCAAGQRFARYVAEPPRVRLLTPSRKLRPRQRGAIAFTLSKVSDVMLQVRDRRGRVALSRGLRGLPGGRHSVAWVPAHAGRHRVRIVAIGPNATRAVVRSTLRAETVSTSKRKAKPSKATPATTRARSSGNEHALGTR